MRYTRDSLLLDEDKCTVFVDASFLAVPDDVLSMILDLINLRRQMLGEVPSELRDYDAATAQRALLDVVLDAADISRERLEKITAVLTAKGERTAYRNGVIVQEIEKIVGLA